MDNFSLSLEHDRLDKKSEKISNYLKTISGLHSGLHFRHNWKSKGEIKYIILKLSTSLSTRNSVIEVSKILDFETKKQLIVFACKTID